MPTDILTWLPDEDVVEANALATVTRHCVIVRSPNGRSQALIAFSSISAVKTVRSSYPGLLVISGGLGIIAGAAAYSSDGHGAAIPAALLALGFLVGFIGTRRASLSFVAGSEITETQSGSLKDAATIASAVESVWKQTGTEAVN